ncbi:MAG: hypothetical protein OEZ16_11555 [Chromatiales bacterium]|nr:hypothetical protein [Chromatiales bacterium]
MVRKLINTLLTLSILAPLSAFAIGLGDVRLNSALSERLSAEIELLSVSPTEGKNLTVSLASQQTFDKIGLDRPALLMYLEFEVIADANGNYTIIVTSREPINEPFLDFLVEVDWKSGRVLRQYTLLLDPPSGYSDTAPAVYTPDLSDNALASIDSEDEGQVAEVDEVDGASNTTEEMAVASADVDEMDSAEDGEMDSADDARSTSVDEETVAQGDEAAEAGMDDEGGAIDSEQIKSSDEKKAPATTPARPVAKSTPKPVGSLVYGPVKANDTLWSIAQRLRPSNDVTVQQMMLALQKANPYAFVDNNINRLKRGYVLRLDDPSAIKAMSKGEAVREVARQTRAWSDYRESVAQKAAQRPAKAAAVKPEPGAVTAAAKTEPKLTLVAPEGKVSDSAKSPSGGAAEKNAGQMSDELKLALETSAAQRKENEVLRSRLSALESQIDRMEKVITLKNADLKALQDQLRKQGSAQLPAATPSQETPVLVDKSEGGKAVDAAVEKPQTVTSEEKKDVAATTAVSDSPANAEAAKPAVAAPGETSSPSPVEPIKPDAAKVEPAKPETKPAEQKKPEQKKPEQRKPRPVVITEPEPEKSFVDEIFDQVGSLLKIFEDPMIQGIIGGVVVIMLLLVVLIIKRRRKGAFQESILNTAGSSSMMQASDEQGSETSFLSDLAISGMGPGTIQTDEGEADPITEAEVFIAYGRHQQAEEVLKKARSISPDRSDIAAKLLEVYYATKDREKFEALIEESVGALQGDDELWGKVLTMGRELCPGNVLFAAEAGATAPAATSKPADNSVGGDVLDIGLDLDELSADMESGSGGGDMDLDLGMDFGDLDAAEDSGSAAESSAEEFDLGDFGLGESDAGAGDEASEMDMDLGALDLGGDDVAAAEESSGLDFDLDLGSSDETTAEEDSGEMSFDLDMGAADEAAEDSSGELDFDLGGSDEDNSGDELGFDLDMGDLDTGADEGDGDMSLDMGDMSAALDMSDDSVSMELDAALDDLSLDDLGDLGDLDDLGDLGDGDDVSQKLDLAQAYSEMGDADGARTMLEEVLSEGNDEQKQQAEALLAKL